MGLLDAYKSATKDWNAKDGKVNTAQIIPAGDYEVMLGKVDHPVYDSGWDCLRFDMQVIAGKYASRHEQLRISLATKTSKGKAMPEFVVSRNIRTIAKIGEMVGLEMKPDYFPDNETDAYERLMAAFKPYEGKTLHMTISETPNKKDSDNPYRNYEFSEGKKISEPMPAEDGAADGAEISDDELPF